MSGAVQALIEAEVGGRFDVRERVVTVGLEATELVGGDPERVGWLFVNRGSADVAVGFRESVTAASGILLAAGGGSISADVREDFVLPAFHVFGVSAVAGQDVVVVEIVRETP